MRKLFLLAALLLLAAPAWALSPAARSVLFSAPPPPTLLFTESSETPTQGVAPPQYIGGSQSCTNSTYTQCVWTFPHPVPAGSTIVGFTHAADDTDQYPGFPDYVLFGTATTFLSPAVEWFPFPEPVSVFYLTNVPAGVTTITEDFGTSMLPGTTTSADLGFAVYSGAKSVVVANPVLLQNTTTPSINITPTQPGLIWSLATNDINVIPNPASLIPAGYKFILNDDAFGILMSQSPRNVSPGTYTVTSTNPYGVTNPGGCNGPLGSPAGCPTVVEAAAVQNAGTATSIDTKWVPAFPNGAASATITRPYGSMAAGSCVLVSLTADLGATVTISDGKGNSYTEKATPASIYARFEYNGGISTGGSSSISASSTGGNLYQAMVDEMSPCAGVDGTPTLQSTASGTTHTAGSITTTVANDLVFGLINTGLSTTSIDPGSGYTALKATNSGGTAQGAYTDSNGPYRYNFENENIAQASAGAIAPFFTTGADTADVGAIAFKP